MSNKSSTLIRPSDPNIVTHASSGRDKTTLCIPCYLHCKDIDRLHEVIHDFLKTCTKTESFIDQLISEEKILGIELNNLDNEQ